MSQFIDITQLLRDKALALPNDTVVKSPHFSLFQGTQALEIDNAKLDSGIIKLSDAEVLFNCQEGRSINEVLWVSDQLFREVFLWLNNSSLACTVFSCRYVEELLIRYNKDMMSGLKACDFGVPAATINSDKEHLLVHKVLRSVVLGVLHFVRLCLNLGQGGVVYEEEDINTQAMNLNVLTMVESEDILKEIQGSIAYLKKTFSGDKDAEVLGSILQVLARLVNVPYYIGVTVPKNSPPIDTSILDELSEYTQHLQSSIEYLNTLSALPGCFSMGIQRRLDNRLPARDLESPRSENYDSLSLFISDVKVMLQIAGRVTSHDVISHAWNFANTRHHVVSRAVYALFLIRDDGSVLGGEKFTELLNEELLRFSCWDSEYINTDNELAKQKIADLTHHISIGFVEWLNITTQNPCRQRQHLSRSIQVFDTLQVNAEALECTLRDTFQIHEEFEYQGEVVAALPITSWLYYMKVVMMLQVVLRGFELELYQQWELYPMYWYCNYLIDHVLLILDRVIKLNESKISRVAQMNKQLKKKKGEQKVRYKEKITRRQAQIPSIQLFIDTLNREVVKHKITQGLTHLQLIQLERYIQAGVIKDPQFPFVKSMETLFNLRMKPFSAVGAPPCPRYSHYQHDLQAFLLHPKTQQDIIELKQAVSGNIKTVLDGIQSREVALGYSLCSDDWTKWYKDLLRSCLGIVIQLGVKPEGRVTVETEGFHRQFPVLKTST